MNILKSLATTKLPPGKLTWQWKMGLLKMYSSQKNEIFQLAMLIYRSVAHNLWLPGSLWNLLQRYRRPKHFVATGKCNKILSSNKSIFLTETMPLIVITVAWHFGNYVVMSMFVVFSWHLCTNPYWHSFSCARNTNAMWRHCSVDPAEGKRFEDSNNDNRPYL